MIFYFCLDLCNCTCILIIFILRYTSIQRSFISFTHTSPLLRTSNTTNRAVITYFFFSLHLSFGVCGKALCAAANCTVYIHRNQLLFVLLAIFFIVVILAHVNLANFYFIHFCLLRVAAMDCVHFVQLHRCRNVVECTHILTIYIYIERLIWFVYFTLCRWYWLRLHCTLYR